MKTRPFRRTAAASGKCPVCGKHAARSRTFEIKIEGEEPTKQQRTYILGLLRETAEDWQHEIVVHLKCEGEPEHLKLQDHGVIGRDEIRLKDLENWRDGFNNFKKFHEERGIPLA